jgi:hypothetical protein
MPTAMAAATGMRTTPVTTATAVTTTTTTTTFRSGITSGRQHGRHNNDGNPDIVFRHIEFRHGTGTGASRTRGLFENAGLTDWFPLGGREIGQPSGAGQRALPGLNAPFSLRYR